MENIAFPFKIMNGEIEVADYAESVKQSIKIILQTAKGERIMQPDFGTNLKRYLFEPLNHTIREIIRTEIINALYEWDDRIMDIEVELVDANISGCLYTTVNYRIMGLNAKDSVRITINN